jgi:hypothetical protein
LPGSLDVISWEDFQAQQPEVARQRTGLLYHYGVGLAFPVPRQATFARSMVCAHRDD